MSTRTQPAAFHPNNAQATRVWPLRVALGAVFLLVSLTYANHFHNSFHFDDGHTIVDNPWIRDLRNIPRFFMDGSTFSTLPPNRSYRPLVSASLAIDYYLGGGLKPLWFHISTFFWFLVQLCLMFALFRNLMNRTRPDPKNVWVALFATAVYGVHPVMAETVNYVIQRGDLYATLGVVAGLSIYALAPHWRRFGVYLLPVAAGILSKPPAAVFPALLFLWIWFFDEDDLRVAVRRSIPSLVISGMAAMFAAKMNPASFVAGATSTWGYRITQPAVLLTYFRTFFIPTGLTADSDRVSYSSLAEPDALIGFLFLAAWCGMAVWAMKRRLGRPVAFGILWFLVASLPTSLIALAEVENDHRMFFPFVGLTLSVSWGAALLLERLQQRIATPVVACGCALILGGFAWGAHERNRVWSTDETLWRDVTIQSPRNGRGLMNYGLTQLSKADYAGALSSFQQALLYTPNYYILETNLGIALGQLGRADEAERHFLRSVQLNPAEATPHYFYGRWLQQVNRSGEAIPQLREAAARNPDFLPARHLLLQIMADEGDAAGLRGEAEQILARFPSDSTARSFLARAADLPAMSADALLNRSLRLYQAGKYAECIAAARDAVKIRPGFAEAWNNIAAASSALKRWDDAIDAAGKAVQLRPDFQLAKNNLAWALAQKSR